MAQYTAPSILQVTLSSLFQEGYSSAPLWSADVTTEIQSKGTQTLMGWLDKMPGMRKWVGPRIINEPQVRTFAIENILFEDSYSISRRSVDANQLNLYSEGLKMFGLGAYKWKDREMGKLIKSNPIGFDGVPFFSASHPVNLDDASMGVYPNTVAAATLVDAYTLAVETASKILGADGENIAFNPTHLLFASANKVKVDTLLNAQIVVNGIGGSMSNIFAGAVTPISAPELNLNAAEQLALGASKFVCYLLDLSKGLKPFVFSVADEPEFQTLNDNPDGYNKKSDNFEYGYRACGGAAVSLPFLAIQMVVG